MIRKIYFLAFLALSSVITLSAQSFSDGEDMNLAADDTVDNPVAEVLEQATPDDEEGVVADYATAENLAQMGDSAYAADDFQLAEKLYIDAMATGGTSSVLFYNLGNAYYRQGNLGKSLVNYERALKIDPTNNDARTNLEFVKTKITDRQIDTGSIMSTLWGKVVCFFHADTWAWITVVLFALFLAGICTYLFSTIVVVKKFSFFGGIVVFFLTVGCVIVSFAAANRVENNDYAIILSPAVQLSTSPREARNQAEEAFLLHEGTKVEIVDSVSSPGEGKWYEVKVGHGERAWIKASEVERI